MDVFSYMVDKSGFSAYPVILSEFNRGKTGFLIEKPAEIMVIIESSFEGNFLNGLAGVYE